ncbi:MAG TPA: dihydrolipoyllysine-residue succinyltransferase, partial [Cryomorphaceae bacterium]|nr:dihydrolipoyllysine-residue succinyltransferase [Cryomorphaceae bacterium]
MILDMKVPSPGESISEVEIASWLVSTGDYVEKDQAIAEVDSDKATLELPAEMSGVIEILVEPGTTVAVGQVVCKIDTSAEAPAGDAPNPAAAPTPMPVAAKATTQTYATGTPSPAAKKILDEKGISAAQAQGTGKDGRITKEDAINGKVA